METLQAEGFQLLPKSTIQELLTFIRSTKVRNTIEFRLNHLLSSDPYFAKPNDSEPIEAFHALVPHWIDWIRTSSMYEWALGFHICCTRYDSRLADAEHADESTDQTEHDKNAIAPVHALLGAPSEDEEIEHTKSPRRNKRKSHKDSDSEEEEDTRDLDDDDQYIPFCVDPIKVDIWVRQYATSDIEFRIFECPNGNNAYSPHTKELKYCRVFCMDPPVWRYTEDYGFIVDLNSKLTSLLPEWAMVRNNRFQHTISIRNLCDPIMITQQRPEKKDMDEPYIATLNHSSTLPDSDAVLTGVNIQMIADQHKRDVAVYEQNQQRMHALRSGQPMKPGTIYMTLGQEEELASYQQTQAVPYLNEMEERFRQHCDEALGFPLGVQLNLNPHMKQQPGAGQSTGGNQQMSIHSTAYQLWLDNQRNHRLFKSGQSVALIEYMIRAATVNTRRLAIRGKHKKDKPLIELRIPGIPQDDKITELYHQGDLKREWYIRYQSLSYNIQPSAFEKERRMPTEVVNKVAEIDAAAAKDNKPKKKAKPK